MNAAATPRNLHVIETGRAHLLLLEPRAAEERVRMGIDEPGHEDAARAVDLPGVAERGVKLGATADCRNPVAFDGDRYVRAPADVIHFEASARAGRPDTGHDLSG